MNILAGMYKTMGEELFREYLSGLSGEELGHLTKNNDGFIVPWDDYNPRGIYVFLDVEEVTGNEELQFAYLGNPTETMLEAAVNDRLTCVYYIGQRGLRISDLEAGTVFTYRNDKDSLVHMAGVKFSRSWDMSGSSESYTDEEIEEMIKEGAGEVKFYFDGVEVDVEIGGRK